MNFKKYSIIGIVLSILSCGEHQQPLQQPQFREDGTLMCDVPYESEISKGLEVFKKNGFSRSQVKDVYFASTKDRFYIEIQNGQIKTELTREADSVFGERARQVIRMLGNIKRRFGVLPDAVFVLNLRDELQADKKSELFPIFSFQKSIKFNDIVFPYPHTFLDIDKIMSEMSSNFVPWLDKKNGLVWRGSQTGGAYSKDTWRHFPRSLLVLKCAEMPTRCDAGFSAFTQVSDEAKIEIEAIIGLKQPIKLERMQEWKYVASLDGNGWADRFVRLLGSSSLVVKQNSEYEEFFYGVLEPYKHYLPVDHNLEDLEEKLEWADRHENEVKNIIENANLFTKKHISQSKIDCYVFNLMKRYGDIVK